VVYLREKELTIVDVVAEAICRAGIKPAEELAPFRTWDELTEPGRGYWRLLAQAAIDAILSEVTRAEHWADSSELSPQDDGRTEWDS
jgi:hypothetical protein